MSKIRVLRVITQLDPGGVERKILDVLPRLDRGRFEVSLVCLREPGALAPELVAAGIRVDCIRFRSRLQLAALRRLAALMRERRIDVVHGHMYRSNVSAAIAARWAGVSRVWAQVHNVDSWETRRQIALDACTSRLCTGVLAVSEQVKRDVLAKLRLPAQRVRVLYNGVDLARFAAGPERARQRRALRAELGAGPGDVVFLSATRLVPQTRPEDLLELARRLLEEERASPGHPPLRSWLAGDGPLGPELEDAARKLPIPGRLRLLGWREDVPALASAADAFVLSSSKEGFSNALLEAMAAGLAVLATDVGGNAEAVRGETDGLIVAPGDAQALHTAARRVWLDSGLRQALGGAARERAKLFSIEEMVKQVEALYST
jgi:glycosyltransferase involved in cell wall biosynthesis